MSNVSNLLFINDFRIRMAHPDIIQSLFLDGKDKCSEANKLSILYGSGLNMQHERP